jgi:hypothetical protein
MSKTLSKIPAPPKTDDSRRMSLMAAPKSVAAMIQEAPVAQVAAAAAPSAIKPATIATRKNIASFTAAPASKVKTMSFSEVKQENGKLTEELLRLQSIAQQCESDKENAEQEMMRVQAELEVLLGANC